MDLKLQMSATVFKSLEVNEDTGILILFLLKVTLIVFISKKYDV